MYACTMPANTIPNVNKIPVHKSTRVSHVNIIMLALCW